MLEFSSGSQILLPSLQIREHTHTHSHTHSHAPLTKTTFVLSCFVLLHNKNPCWLKAPLLSVRREAQVGPTPLPAGISCLHCSYRWEEAGRLDLGIHPTPTLVPPLPGYQGLSLLHALLCAAGSPSRTSQTSGDSSVVSGAGRAARADGERRGHEDVHVPRVECLPAETCVAPAPGWGQRRGHSWAGMSAPAAQGTSSVRWHLRF